MDGKKGDRRDEDIEFMDLDEEDEYRGGREDDWEEEWQDEPEPPRPWAMVLMFVGLVVLAAIICTILWRFTHAGQDQGGAADQIAAETPDVSEPDTPSAPPEEQQADIEDDAPGDDLAGEEDVPEPVQPDPTEEPSAEPTEEPVSTPEPEPETVAPEVPTDGDSSMRFDPVEESVTPKDVLNLRSVPSTADDGTVVMQVANGEVLSRTGINSNTGWSRIDHNGQTLYAVTQYLTTDLNYRTPVKASDPNRVSTIDGRVIIFTNCDDQITPKEYVNLRTEPSTTEGSATVRCQINNGEVVHRTGYSADSGWSRVEYNGEVLYVVTSLMTVQ